MFGTFFFENLAVYEIMSKTMVEPESQQMRIWRMRVACWINKATRTQGHAYVCGLTRKQKRAILITFPQQQCFRERASIVTFYVHCLSCLYILMQTFTGCPQRKVELGDKDIKTK